MKYLLLNHKMNLLGQDLSKYIENFPKGNNIVVFPTSIYIPYFLGKNILVGCQDVSSKDMGSVTSEVSANQLKSIGVEYVLIGHSERREAYQEEDKEVNDKIKRAINAGLKIVICIGEKNGEDKFEVINKQLETALENITSINNILIAYEPVSAIGSGTAITNEEINEVTEWIKNWFMEKYQETPTILYGGSVNDINIEELVNTKVEGFLVGGASLSIEKVNKMQEVITNN